MDSLIPSRAPLRQIYTEDRVKKEAMAFFRRYYRFHPSEGVVVTSYDLEGEGLVVDGFLSLPQKDGTDFTVAFEATAADTRYEVLTTLNKSLLYWDGLAFAGGFMTLNLLLDFFSGNRIIHPLPWYLSLGVAIVLFVAAFAFWALALRRWRRYRSIYAVDQFKAYDATEQWIVLAPDVYPPAFSKHHKELKYQCAINGFGLLVLGGEQAPFVDIAPAQRDVFKGSRRNVRLDALRGMGKNIGTDRVEAGLRNWQTRFRSHYLGSFAYKIQGLWLGAGVLLSGAILANYWTDRPFAYPDEDRYVKELEIKKEQLRPETKLVYMTDSLAVPYRPGVAGYLDLEIEEKMRERTAFNNWRYNIIIGADYDQLIYYDCARLYNLRSTKYLIAVEQFESGSNARVLLQELRAKGLAASILRLDCFQDEGSGYLVFLGLLEPNQGMAKTQRAAFARQLKRAGFNQVLSVRQLRPNNLVALR